MRACKLFPALRVQLQGSTPTTIQARRILTLSLSTSTATRKMNLERPPKRLGQQEKLDNKDPAGRNWKPKRTKRERNITEGSSEDVLRLDIEALVALKRASLQETGNGDGNADSSASPAVRLPEEGTETEVEILELSSTGDGLGMKEGSLQVFVVPFTVPGDVVRVKVFKHMAEKHHTIADFISITKPSPLRDDGRVRCPYFGKCGGCQFQMLDYSEQLKLKKRILEKAFSRFSNLAPELVPAVGDTIGSPLQYDYRTKLTPHFDGPPGARHGRNKSRNREPFPECPPVGFMLKGTRKTLDIEDCPIGTPAVRRGLKTERQRMLVDFKNYSKGATLLLRENTKRYPKDSPDLPLAAAVPSSTSSSSSSSRPEYVDVKTCETDHKAITSEYIDDYLFTNPANSFFQNNNSILPKFTAYIRDHILPPQASTPIRYLIDAYSGSGLFTITLSSRFAHSTGIDIAADSISCARRNAELNGLTASQCSFIAADANELFKTVEYNPDETVVVLDPPRKGCDDNFLRQLRQFGPRRIVYVSCNVHTQARDVGVLVRGEGKGSRFTMESVVGFDFFPQTGHVEGVAILNRVDERD